MNRYQLRQFPRQPSNLGTVLVCDPFVVVDVPNVLDQCVTDDAVNGLVDLGYGAFT